MDTVPSGHHTWAELLTRVDAAAGVRYFPGDGGDWQNPGRIPRLRRRQLISRSKDGTVRSGCDTFQTVPRHRPWGEVDTVEPILPPPTPSHTWAKLRARASVPFWLEA
jgi:hypothetical protein